jgi:hypothetical protein
MSEKDRFDLEQDIMKCWNVTDDIDLLYRGVLERDMTSDEVANALLGIKTLYAMRFDELFRTFERLIQAKKII